MTRRRSLRRDHRALTTVEFALILPVLLTTMLGLGEMSFEQYVKSTFVGAIQKAARDSTIQGNSDPTATAALDQIVIGIMKLIVPKATFSSTRVNYDNYSAIAGEPFTDSRYPANTGTYDGVCNHGESYIDQNGNGQYDLDVSASGQGGANDITKYTMTMTYTRLFPYLFAAWGSSVTLTSSTLLKNQPYATQITNSGTSVGTCK